LIEVYIHTELAKIIVHLHIFVYEMFKLYPANH